MKENFTIKKGDTFRKKISIQNSNNELKNLTSCSARMKIKTSDLVTTLISLEVGSGITFDLVSKEMTFLITKVQTRAFAPGTYVYDIEFTDENSEDDTILEGSFIVTPEVTDV